MTTKEFIEKSIDGGYNIPSHWQTSLNYSERKSLFLDPKAWEAVGKVEGWGDTGIIAMYEYSNTEDFPKYPRQIKNSYMPVYQVYMHQMIDALINGKTIDEYIEKL